MRGTYNPDFESSAPARRTRFRPLEIRHLLLASVGLTVALAFVRAEGAGPGQRFDMLLADARVLIAAAIAVLVGFIGHELAHKLVAQRYGHWAEFRVWPVGLGLGLAMAILARFLFALPGAVYIMGNVTKRENGIISLVGPAINIVVAAAATPFLFATDPDADLPFIVGTVGYVNALLAVFNLIPFGAFDGRKVWMWSRPVWAVSFAVAAGLFALTLVKVVTLDV